MPAKSRASSSIWSRSASIFSMPAPHPHLQRNSTGEKWRKGRTAIKNILLRPPCHGRKGEAHPEIVQEVIEILMLSEKIIFVDKNYPVISHKM